MCNTFAVFDFPYGLRGGSSWHRLNVHIERMSNKNSCETDLVGYLTKAGKISEVT